MWQQLDLCARIAGVPPFSPRQLLLERAGPTDFNDHHHGAHTPGHRAGHRPPNIGISAAATEPRRPNTLHAASSGLMLELASSPVATLDDEVPEGADWAVVEDLELGSEGQGGAVMASGRGSPEPRGLSRELNGELHSHPPAFGSIASGSDGVPSAAASLDKGRQGARAQPSPKQRHGLLDHMHGRGRSGSGLAQSSSSWAQPGLLAWARPAAAMSDTDRHAEEKVGSVLAMAGTMLSEEAAAGDLEALEGEELLSGRRTAPADVAGSSGTRRRADSRDVFGPAVPSRQRSAGTDSSSGGGEIPNGGE